MSVRALARKYGVHRRTVHQALASPLPPERKVPQRSAPVLGPWKAQIDAWLVDDLSAPRKQRHTASRIHERLIAECEAHVSYTAVQRYVKRRRPEIKAVVGSGPADGFVPQVREPGAEAEVDFGEVAFVLRGRQVTARMFVLRMSFSGFAVHRVFPAESQDALLAGHVAAFEVLGGVPVRQIRYDNLTAAVNKVLVGRGREEQVRWTAFREHYGFNAFYCQPGIKGAHEKGGVEGEVGYFRRRHFVPVPKVESLAELNERLALIDANQAARVIARRPVTVGADFEREQPLLAPLPAEPFQVFCDMHLTVDAHARITVHTNRYSVPASLIGAQVRARVEADAVTVFHGARQVWRRERIVGKLDERLLLDDYLELLVRKPGALPGSVPLATARAEGAFTDAPRLWWDTARAAHGDAAGTRELIEVLLAHRHVPHRDLVAGLEAAAVAGAFTADAVKIITRGIADAPTIRIAADSDQAGVLVPLADAQASGSPGGGAGQRNADDAPLAPVIPLRPRPLPALGAYDNLLANRQRPDTGTGPGGTT